MLTLGDFEPLVPEPPARAEMVVRWAVVTSAAPLRVRFDGDTAEQPGTPVSMVPGLGAGVRVLCMILGRQTIVMGSPTGGTPPGTLWAFAGAVAPPGWLLAQGQLVARAGYPSLFAAIGTAYGAGDGVSTFRVPDGRGRVLVGQDPTQAEFAARGQTGGEKAHRLTMAEVVQFHMWLSDTSYNPAVATGINAGSAYGAATLHQTPNAAHNNLQPYVVANLIIKT